MSVGGRFSRAMILHEVTFRELWETIMAIEPAMAALAARKRSACGSRPDRSQYRADTAPRWRRRSVGFARHRISRLGRRRSGQRAIVLAREALGQLIHPAFKAVLVDGGASVAGPRLLAAHEAIAQAIADSDMETTSKWMERHIADFRKAYEVLGFQYRRATPACRPRLIQSEGN